MPIGSLPTSLLLEACVSSDMQLKTSPEIASFPAVFGERRRSPLGGEQLDSSVSGGGGKGRESPLPGYDPLASGCFTFPGLADVSAPRSVTLVLFPFVSSEKGRVPRSHQQAGCELPYVLLH